MNDTAIRIERLGKMYRIGGMSPRYDTLRESIMAAVSRPLRLFRRSSLTKSRQDTIWALRHLSFEVQRQEVLGIIGRNGAGKSTLLKILSRITKPTEGRAILRGKVGSLLEVGTGFHSELTGRENIYLSGAILGMNRHEIERKFDEIVAFAEIDRFVDTPVKYYSSGMYMRLAFAVAAHLEPEILLVDEVLAVGDNMFQTKCLKKMKDINQEGRTVLFVSHNMPAILSLCSRALLLETGTIANDGPATEVVREYLSKGMTTTGHRIWPEGRGPGNRSFQLVSVSLEDSFGRPAQQVKMSEEFGIGIEFEVIQVRSRVQFSVVLFDANGYCVLSSPSNCPTNALHDQPLGVGRYWAVCRFYGHLLNSGRYSVSIIGASQYWTDSFHAHYVISFEAMDDGILRGDYPGTYGGVIRPKLRWEMTRMNTQKEKGRSPLG